jgi:hypothetical protein
LSTGRCERKGEREISCDTKQNETEKTMKERERDRERERQREREKVNTGQVNEAHHNFFVAEKL